MWGGIASKRSHPRVMWIFQKGKNHKKSIYLNFSSLLIFIFNFNDLLILKSMYFCLILYEKSNNYWIPGGGCPNSAAKSNRWGRPMALWLCRALNALLALSLPPPPPPPPPPPNTFLMADVLRRRLSMPLEPRCWRLLWVVSEFLVRYRRWQNSQTYSVSDCSCLSWKWRFNE